ncbi:MAG: tetratricopeptide repeat protein [Proteobacteria bacterium]|nr:tetratricopeptide repeat protein [Pseudomonadota bacterium]
MEQNDQKRPEEIVQSTEDRRDATPSFIRNVEARAELLNPERHSGTNFPVLTMPTSVKVWRTIRWPLFVLVVVVVLATVGFVTHDLLIDRSVERTIVDSQNAEELGRIRSIKEISQILHQLSERNVTRANAQVAFAWQAVLHAALLGPEKEWAEKADTAFGRASDEDDSVAMAVRAGLIFFEGDYDKALEQAEEGLAQYAQEPRLRLVKGLILIRMGKIEEATRVLDGAIDLFPNYVPLLIARVALEFESGNRLEAAMQVERLLAVSPTHLYGSLIAIALALPDWGGPGLQPDRVTALLDDINSIAPVIESAPPKIALLGQLLTGRVNLLAGHYQEAIDAFSKIIAHDTSSAALAWYADATRKQDGPEVAIALLDKYPDRIGPAVYDIRAQCLLVHHRVDEARPVISRLKATGALTKRLKHLTWILHVRSGNMAEAMKSMPKRIRGADQLIALELYYLLRDAGRIGQIEKLVRVFDRGSPSCSKAIRAWHSRKFRAAFRALKTNQRKPTCLFALAANLMRGRIEAGKLKSVVDRLNKQAVSNLRVQIDSAMVTWLLDGRDAAINLLNDIWNKKPEGVPLLCDLGRAYLEIKMPARTLEVLGGKEDPEALALRIFAARAAGQKKFASDLVKTAIQKSAETPEPALVYFALQKELAAGNMGTVVDGVFAILHKSGHWTAKIAELGAKAFNTIGKKPEADRLLYQISKQVFRSSGIGEALDTRFAQILLNMRRGGKSTNRALYLLTTLKEEGAKDPRLVYNLGLINIEDGNERLGIRYLKQALVLDPTFESAYTKLSKMDKLNQDLILTMKRTWQELSPDARQK